MSFYLIVLSVYWLILVGTTRSANLISDANNSTLNQKLEHKYLTSLEFRLFEESLNLVESGDCRRDLNSLLQGLKNDLPWAIKSKCRHNSSNLTVFSSYNRLSKGFLKRGEGRLNLICKSKFN